MLHTLPHPGTNAFPFFGNGTSPDSISCLSGGWTSNAAPASQGVRLFFLWIKLTIKTYRILPARRDITYQTKSQLSGSFVRNLRISFALGKADLWNESTSA